MSFPGMQPTANIRSSYTLHNIFSFLTLIYGLPRWLSGRQSACQCRRCRFKPWVGKISWKRKWQPTPVFLSGKCHRQSSLEDYSPCGHKELDITQPLNNKENSVFFLFHLECSCVSNLSRQLSEVLFFNTQLRCLLQEEFFDSSSIRKYTDPQITQTHTHNCRSNVDSGIPSVIILYLISYQHDIIY